MCDGVLHCLWFAPNVFLVSCMAINVNVQYNDGFSPRHYTVDPMLSASGNLFKCHEVVLYLQPFDPT